MGILDIFKKETEFVAGLNIDSNGDFQLIELQKINTSYSPVFTHSGVLENFAQDGIFRKKSFIRKFKSLRDKLHSGKVSLNSFANKKLENEIKSALRITGFENISIHVIANIDGIILSTRSDFQRMSVYFSGSTITFTTTEHGKITRREILNMSDFRVSTVVKLTAHLAQKHVFLSGMNPVMLDPITGVFYQAGIKVHLQNIWENFLHFSDAIPKLFPEESHEFISALSLAVPHMRKWKTISLKTSPEKIPKKEENILDTKTIFLPKPKGKKFLKKPVSKKIVDKSTGKIHKLTAKQTPKKKNIQAIRKVEKELDYNLEGSEQTYLPKKIRNMFLSKPKKSGIWKKVKSILGSEI